MSTIGKDSRRWETCECLRCLGAIALSLLVALISCSFARTAVAAEDFFTRQVQPILQENCFKCHSHSAEKIKGGLVLDSLDGMLTGGDTGAAVIPGYAIWSPDERKFVLRFDEPVGITGNILIDTQRIQNALERAIRAYPDQWLWIHRRWKTRPPGEEPLY